MENIIHYGMSHLLLTINNNIPNNQREYSAGWTEICIALSHYKGNDVSWRSSASFSSIRSLHGCEKNSHSQRLHAEMLFSNAAGLSISNEVEVRFHSVEFRIFNEAMSPIYEICHYIPYETTIRPPQNYTCEVCAFNQVKCTLLPCNHFCVIHVLDDAIGLVKRWWWKRQKFPCLWED